ncbi:M15 family metallopeptidase [Streptomyces sp. GESEQ-35]|uniref:M15 family metallopeptidase n=1 Tax=Streptomyces sp. GESEQ-35 TaxID=2812657 RepID=UPI001B326181|nr:M15 family metallopeptidase [Streptomyces sp. GESEQ-35]
MTEISPPAERAEPTAPADFVALADIDPTIRQEMRYATAHNFVGTQLDGYDDPCCVLTRPAAGALSRAQQILLRDGFALKVYDGYRPQAAVDHMVHWSRDPEAQHMKSVFYPYVDKELLFADGYVAARSGHSRGSTVDVTLTTSDGEVLDMGTEFDFFDPRSHTLHPDTEPVPRENRRMLTEAMASAGFVNLPEEWWHFTLAEEPFPDSYFGFPVRRSALHAPGRPYQLSHPIRRPW